MIVYTKEEGDEMSLGFCGIAEKYIEDSESILYLYSGENWNDEKSISGDMNLLDGEIIIQKSCLVEPEIHLKYKKSPSGRKKLVEKRILREVDIDNLINDRNVIISKTTKNEFEKWGIQRPFLAYSLIHIIFDEYQINGVLPEKVSFIQ